jgi:hypothetical protein
MHASPHVIDKDLQNCPHGSHSWAPPIPFALGNHDPHGGGRFTELLVVDEADRLKMPSLKQPRDHHNGSRRTHHDTSS